MILEIEQKLQLFLMKSNESTSILEMRTGRADLYGPRAEIIPRKKQGLHEKSKISCKILIKFTLDKEIFLKNLPGLRPRTPYLLSRFSILYFYLNDIWILCEILFNQLNSSQNLSQRAERAGPKKIGPCAPLIYIYIKKFCFIYESCHRTLL